MRFRALVLSLSVLFSGCGEYAAKGAGEGAAMGAASGAVSGLVSALIFGGDPAEAAARGAVYGGSMGATAGAIRGGQVDAQIQQKRQAQENSIRAEIGEDAFSGLSDLIACDHARSLGNASQAMRSENPNYSLAGSWLEVLVYADSGEDARTEALLGELVSIDWEIDDLPEAKSSLVELQDELRTIRGQYRMAVECPN